MQANSSLWTNSSNCSCLSNFALQKEWSKTSIIVSIKLQRRWIYSRPFKEIEGNSMIICQNVITKNCNYLCSRPRVHANMDAILLVLVSSPFWYSLKCRVTVPCAASASNVFPSDDNYKRICENNWQRQKKKEAQLTVITNTEVIKPREPNPAPMKNNEASEWHLRKAWDQPKGD